MKTLHTVASEQKYCPKCLKVKSVNDFHKNSARAGGRQCYCIECKRIIDNSYSRESRHKIATKSRKKHAAQFIYREVIKRAVKAQIDYCSRDIFIEWYNSVPRVCVYCGHTEEWALTQFKRRLHVDRKIPSLGYIIDNICLACHRCNVTKNGYLTFDQMKIVADLFFKESEVSNG